MSRRVSLAAVWLAVAVPPVLAQGSNPADMTVDAATRRQVIDGVLARLTEAYVFPDTAVAMERAIRDRVRRGEYERITSAQALADSLTAHLQAVSQDRHLRVRYSDEPLPRLDAQPGRTPEMEARAYATASTAARSSFTSPAPPRRCATSSPLRSAAFARPSIFRATW